MKRDNNTMQTIQYKIFMSCSHYKIKEELYN